MHPSNLRKLLHGKNFNYETSLFDFKSPLEELFGCKLSCLHKHLGSYNRFKRSNDQSTLAHKVFYSNYEKLLKPLYIKFMHEYIAHIISPHKAYYQSIPTFRIGLPGNVFVGEFHKDSDYNHRDYEINFNLGLSGYTGPASLKTQVSPDSEDYMLLESPYGSIFSFDHIDCLHGSEINTSDETIVSFDFRIALVDLFYETESSSVNMSSRFSPGSYFSSEIVNSLLNYCGQNIFQVFLPYFYKASLLFSLNKPYLYPFMTSAGAPIFVVNIGKSN